MSSNGNYPPNVSTGLSEEKRRLLEQRLRRGARSSTPAPAGIPPRPQNVRRLASLGQARIWVLDDLSENSPGYNITSSFIVESEINVAALGFALNKVVERHETLRSSFSLVDGEVQQSVKDALTLSVEQQDCTSLTDACQAAQGFARIPFNMQNGPLLRIGLFSASAKSHVLILSIHDIVFDKWSLKLFWSEFSSFYKEGVTGIPAALPALPIAYSDFAYWQREWLKKGEQQRQINYWKKRLENPPAPIPLPTDRPYPNSIADPGSLVRSRIPDSISKAVRRFSNENEVSLFTTFLLGFGILLARYSETDDILISSPVANRRKKETANLIGFFLNTLVARIDLSGNPTVNEALSRAKTTVAGALDHQDLPTDVIVDALKPARSPGRHPLFQTMFVFQREDEGAPKLNLQDCSIRPTFIETKTSKFDLSLFVAESGEGFETVVEFRTDIFQEETIQRFLEHFNTLLSDFTKHPAKRIQELSLLPPSEIHSLLDDFQGRPLSTECTLPLPLQIIEQARITPQAAAVSCGSKRLAYDELSDRAHSLACKLTEIPGYSPGAPVGLFIERSIDAIIGLLAIQLAGCPYLPIDPAYPPKRNQAVIEDAKPFAILSTSNHLKAVRGLTTLPVVVTSDSGSSRTELPSLTHSDLAYIIYTSGSTGKPKGVPITHGNLAHSTQARAAYYSETPDRYLLLSSLSFDSSVAGIFWPLSSGKTLVVLPSGEERDAFTIRETIAKEKVTALLCIPTLYREIIAGESNQLSTLRLAIVAGEACPLDLVDSHHRAIPTCELYNEYGPTEATVWCTATKLKPNFPVTIGQAIPGYQTHVFSPSRQLQPIGIPGELYVAGPGVSKGYLPLGSSTDNRFSYLQLPGEQPVRMYQTGDRVRRLHSGDLEYLGRVDEQAKLNGFRFEPSETEAALRSIDGVVETVAKVVTDKATNHSRLIAYIVARKSFNLDSRSLKKLLSEQLPPHAVPTQFVTVQAIPRLPNGKVHTQALPLPSSHSLSKTPFEEPTNAIEFQLVAIWKEVLGLDSVSTRDNFFEVGGTSLQAIRVFSRIHETFHTKISSSRLLQAPTIKQLAKLLDSKELSKKSRCLVPFRTKGHLPPIFMVHSGGLEVLFYKDLVKRVDDRIPLYGLQAVGHDGSEPPLKSIAAMAARYLSEIEEVHPHGPYILFGHCVGVTVTLELARQILSKGKEVPLVVSIDGKAPLPLDYIAPPKPTHDPFPYYPPGLKQLRIQLRKTRHRLREKRLSDAEREALLLKRTHRALRAAYDNYRVAQYEGPVLAFRCRDSEDYTMHSTAQWHKAAPDLEMRYIDCTHDEILIEPWVDQTAAIIRERLARMPLYTTLRTSVDSQFVSDEKESPENPNFNSYSATAPTHSGIQEILRSAVHSQNLKDTATSLQAKHGDSLDSSSNNIIQLAVSACDSISRHTRASQDEVVQVLRANDLSVAEVSRHTERNLQYHAYSLRIEQSELEAVLKLLQELGFNCPLLSKHSEGAWECKKRFLDKVDLIKVDDATTRLTLCWDLNYRIAKIPRDLTPSDTEFCVASFSRSFWWLYFAMRPFRFLNRKVKKRSPTVNEWPFLGTPIGLIKPLLEFAEVDTGETLLDIGCGDGRILTEATSLHQTNGLGIERDPNLAALARDRIHKLDFTDQISILEESFSGHDISQADVVFLFLPVASLPELINSILPQLKPGARILVHEQAPLPYSLKPNKSLPIFNDSGITVAHLWRK